MVKLKILVFILFKIVKYIENLVLKIINMNLFLEKIANRKRRRVLMNNLGHQYKEINHQKILMDLNLVINKNRVLMNHLGHQCKEINHQKILVDLNLVINKNKVLIINSHHFLREI